MTMANDENNKALTTFLSAIESNCYLILSNATNGITAKKPVQPSKRRGAATAIYDLALSKEGSDDKKFLRFFERRVDFGGVKNNAYGGVIVEPFFVVSSSDENDADGAGGENAAVTIYHKKKKKYLTIDKKGDYKSSNYPIPLHVETYQDSEGETAPVLSEDETTVEDVNSQRVGHRDSTSYDIFLKAVESKSFLQLSTFQTAEEYSARLLVQPVLHSERNDVKLYSLGKDSTAKERFLRLFRWNIQMVNFDGDSSHEFGGMIVRPWSADDDDGDGDSPSGITLFNEKVGVYLSINENGMFVTSNVAVLLHVKLIEVTAVVDSSVLGEDDKEHFKTQGYIILRQAILKEFIDAARHNINWQIGSKGKVDTKHFPTNLRAKIINHSPILWSALNILLGEGNIQPWEGERRFQIAMRYPHTPYHGTFDPKKYQREYTVPGEKRWHIDCAQCECPFTLLVGIALSDQTEKGSGCLYVYPGTHLTDEVREYKEDCLGKDKSYSDKSENKPKMGEPVPVYLEKGDVVLAHAMLPHTASDN
ncbi:hypothetical protein ACHAXS_007619, partial [Conticribra weissflogii]